MPEQPSKELRMVNYVVTANLGCNIDLRDTGLRAHNVEYNPKRFSALVLRKRNPSMTCLVFSTGRIVMTGLKTESDAPVAFRSIKKMFTKLGYLPKGSGTLRIQNIVATFNVMRKLSLVMFNAKFYNQCIYEPELFPGLSFRMRQEKCTLLIFQSGKVVITGARCERDAVSCYTKILPVLETL